MAAEDKFAVRSWGGVTSGVSTLFAERGWPLVGGTHHQSPGRGESLREEERVDCEDASGQSTSHTAHAHTGENAGGREANERVNRAPGGEDRKGERGDESHKPLALTGWRARIRM